MADPTYEHQAAWEEMGALTEKVHRLENERALILSRMEHAVDQYALLLRQIDDMKNYMVSRAAHPGTNDGKSHWDMFVKLNPEYLNA